MPVNLNFSDFSSRGAYICAVGSRGEFIDLEFFSGGYLEVIFYQLFIAGTILVAHRLTRVKVLYVCWGWTAFTIVNLFYPPLILIQLAVVWGTYHLLNSSEEKDRKIVSLEELISDLPQNLQRKVEIVSTDYKRLLSGAEHLSYLQSQIRGAEKSVMILSGWLSSRVVDSEFLKLVESKLKTGVVFHVGYGWQDSKGAHRSSEDLQRALRGLKQLADKFPNRLYVAEYATHEKMLVVDSVAVVFGSANWLSNRQYKNSERSIVVTDNAIASSEEQRIATLVRKNSII